MNKKIRELAKEHICYYEERDGSITKHYEFDDADMEEFVQSIVDECAKCVIFGEISAEPPYDRVIPALLEQLADDMKNHFGIE